MRGSARVLAEALGNEGFDNAPAQDAESKLCHAPVKDAGARMRVERSCQGCGPNAPTNFQLERYESKGSCS